jgi:fatty-acyl-CoA synthase
MKSSIYTQGLDKNSANYVAQSPLTFIERAATVYPNRPAVIHGDIQRSWAHPKRRLLIKTGSRLVLI